MRHQHRLSCRLFSTLTARLLAPDIAHIHRIYRDRFKQLRMAYNYYQTQVPGWGTAQVRVFVVYSMRYP